MRLRLLFCVLFSLFVNNQIFAQQNREIPIAKIHADTSTRKPKADTTILSKKGKPQTDLYEVLSRLLNENAKPASDTVTTRPVVSVVPAIGYTLVSRLAIVLSGNMAFRTGPYSRVSTIVASTSYTQNKQFSVPVQTSIWSRDNRYNFIGDYRFYKYPQSTFGLGSSSNIQNEDPMDYKFIRFYETAYRRITGNFYAGAGYMLDTHYDIIDNGNVNGTVTDYSRYGKEAHSIASGFGLSTLYDSRDNGLNASKGAFVSLTYRTALTSLGSTQRWNSLMMDARKYFKFPANSDNVIALWNFDWVMLSGSPAYLDLPSLSWDSNSATGRGYIQGRFRGAQMFYGEAEYRFRITGNGLIGGVVFANASTFSAAQGTKLQRVQPGFGPGLRIKLNKVSNTNISVDYGFGMQGSRGLFIDVGEAF